MSALMTIWHKAHGIVVRKGVPVDDADELVQEAFLKLERYERDHDVRSKEAFVVAAAINLAIDRSRRALRRQTDPMDASEFDTMISEDVPVDEAMESRARLDRLQAGLATLPEKTRRILLARRLDGLGFREIAAQEGDSVSAVEKQVARATLVLMKWMDGW
jgi:RNA polymerase sigma-70 factor (ECF subfamily)